MAISLKNLYKRHKKMTIIIMALSAVLIAFNLFMLVFAICEHSSQWGRQWCEQPQQLKAQQPENGRTVVMVHGFGGSPLDLKPLAEHLAQKGFRVVVPCVPNQAKATFAYQRGHTPDYYRRWLVDLVKRESKRSGRKPYLVGFSMGATLSTLVAAENEVDKLVLLAPFFSLPHADMPMRFLAPVIRYIIPLVPKLSRGRINDPQGYAQYWPGTFIVSVGAFAGLEQLAAAASDKARTVAIPTLIVGSTNDRVASFARTRELFAGNSHVRVCDYPRSNHVLLYDHDRLTIVQSVTAFLLRGEKI